MRSAVCSLVGLRPPPENTERSRSSSSEPLVDDGDDSMEDGVEEGHDGQVLEVSPLCTDSGFLHPRQHP